MFVFLLKGIKLTHCLVPARLPRIDGEAMVGIAVAGEAATVGECIPGLILNHRG